MACAQPLGDDVATSHSIWYRKLGAAPSCSAPEATATDPVVAHGCEDPTALHVDLGKAGSAEAKGRCFHYASDCAFDVNRVKEIRFDLSAQGCADVWAAPLWMVPPSWGPTQRRSGEIDFFEFCGGSPNVSFGSDPGDYDRWPVSNPDDVSGQVRILFDDVADKIEARICDVRGQSCKVGYVRAGYFRDIKGSFNPSGAGMKFVSDVWNGSHGDDGFKGCARGGEHDSSCQYSVRNIKVLSKTGEKLFDGACAALNG